MPKNSKNNLQEASDKDFIFHGAEQPENQLKEHQSQNSTVTASDEEHFLQNIFLKKNAPHESADSTANPPFSDDSDPSMLPGQSVPEHVTPSRDSAIDSKQTQSAGGLWEIVTGKFKQFFAEQAENINVQRSGHFIDDESVISDGNVDQHGNINHINSENPEQSKTSSISPDDPVPVVPPQNVLANGNAAASTIDNAKTDGNQAPEVEAVDLGSTNEDSAVKITAKDLLANSSDVDGDTLQVVGVSVDERYGSVEYSTDGNGNIETIQFTPAENYHGDAVPLQFVVSDGQVKSSGTASIDVTAVNDAASIGNVDLGSTNEDSAVEFTAKDLLANSSDADGDTLKVVDVTVEKEFGTVEFSVDEAGNVETIKFTPVENFSGDDVPLNFVVSDGHEQVEGTAHIDVTTVADEPVINEIHGTWRSESIDGTDSNDAIFGEGGNDVIKAGDGNDVLSGGDGWDTLQGGAGDDTFVQNAGDDFDAMYGGEGTDRVVRGEGDGDIGLAGNFGAANSIEEINAGGNDIVGDWRSNTLDFSDTKLENVGEIRGEGGNDSIIGSYGDDTILGGDGNDALRGGAGNDTAFGESGNDTYSFNSFDGQDAFHGGTSWTDTIQLDASNSADPQNPWTITVDGQQVDPDQGADFIEFDGDTSGVVTMADGSTLNFDGVERIEW